jgi:hypothetical protein
MTLIEKWDELRTLFESVELDVKKSSKGNKSAGVRARRGLRMIKQAANELVKISKTIGSAETPAE